MTNAKDRAAASAWRWQKWLLVTSLALNLVIVGVIGGAALRHKRGDTRPLMVRDVALGPYTEALSRDDRDLIRRAFLDGPQAMRAERDAAVAEFDALSKALRATPFSIADVGAVMDRQRVRLTGRLQLGQNLLLERIEAMSADGRAAFADRLAHAINDGPGRRGEHAADH